MGQILGAIAGFTDRALVEASLLLLLDGSFEPRAATALLFNQRSTSRAIVWGFVKDRWSTLLARLPAASHARLFGLPATFCDEAHRADVKAFLGERAAAITGARRPLAQSLESISLCIARRDASRESVRAFLKKQ